jgi:hypothetical protein
MYVYFTTIENNMNTRNYLKCFCLFQRRELESKQVAAEDARLVQESLRYEVTTARIDDEVAEQARSVRL